MLTKLQKKEIIADLTGRIKEAKSVVFLDFKGTSVKDVNELKRELRKEKISLKVTRKTLIDRALSEAGVEMKTKEMEGQIAVSFSPEDEVAPARIIAKFSKGKENLKITGGILGIQPMSVKEVKALAALPTKDELLGKLVGTINAPISGFVNVLAGNLRGLVQVLKAVSEKK